jgi:hypothetical protein
VKLGEKTVVGAPLSCSSFLSGIRAIRTGVFNFSVAVGVSHERVQPAIRLKTPHSVARGNTIRVYKELFYEKQAISLVEV